MIKWLYYGPFSGKFANYFREQSQETFFSEPGFVETRNSELQSCNFKGKGAVLHKDLFEILEILEHSFFPKHFQKSICGGVFSPVGCRLWLYKFIKKKLSYIRFSGKFPVFDTAISKYPHQNICDGV